jgi:hypothetical protein
MGLCFEEWTVDWFSLVDTEGMTNYTHCKTSGHIVYYIKYWLNFYHYGNQGWEHFNSKYRYVYCHMTQTGGSSGTHGEAGSNMKPIDLWFLHRLYLWFLHRLYWLTKGADAHLPQVDA